MENYLESARRLVEKIQEQGEFLGKLEEEFIVKYAFYAEDFEKVERLANTLKENGYEKEHGRLDLNTLWAYEREMMQKNQVISEFASMTNQARELLYQGFDMLDKMKAFLKEKGMLVDYQQYLFDKEMEEQRAKLKQEKGEKERGVQDKCQR